MCLVWAGLSNPRIAIEGIKEFYDNEYIAHRKKADWGVLTRFYNRAMEKHDREKDKIVTKVFMPGPNSKILTLGARWERFFLHERSL